MKWISIADEMPEIDETVLVSDGESVCIGFYGTCTEYNSEKFKRGFGDYTGFCGINFGYDGEAGPYPEVTHWMPLPEPPTGESHE